MTKRLLLILLLTMGAVSPGQAQDAVDEQLRRYAVEMIVFRYNQNVSTGSEQFVADEPEVDAVYSDAAGAQTETTKKPTRKRIRSNHRPVPLPAAEFTMGEAWSHLQRLDVYRPVMHFGWTQVMQPDHETAAQSLSRFATPPRGLSGELKMYLGRYLHLVVDLELAGSGPVRYHIQEDRIFKNGDVRYFDHPKFGVLAKITRVKEPQAGEDPGNQS